MKRTFKTSITSDEYMKMTKTSKLSFFERIGFKFYLIYNINNDMYYARKVCSWWLYILMFIPVAIYQFFYVLYDGGLSEYSIGGRSGPTHLVSFSTKQFFEDYGGTLIEKD